MGELRNLVLNDTIRSTILYYLSEEWVHETYDWKNDFTFHYFTNWFNDANGCYQYIHNSARTYSKMAQTLAIYGYPFMNTLDTFNTYVMITANELLIRDNNVTDKIENILRIKRLKHIVPMIIRRQLLPELRPNILTYLGECY